MKKIIGILITGLSKISRHDSYDDPKLKFRPIEFIHLFCKHGAFICNSFMTPEELDMVAISESHAYLRMEKNMEKSQIINVVCLKMLNYNAIPFPEKVDAERFSDEETTMRDNLFFIGSIWYEICLELQDRYLCTAPIKNYDIGNWKGLAERFGIKPAKSLVYKESEAEKDELISGLMGEKKIRENSLVLECFEFYF